MCAGGKEVSDECRRRAKPLSLAICMYVCMYGWGKISSTKKKNEVPLTTNVYIWDKMSWTKVEEEDEEEEEDQDQEEEEEDEDEDEEEDEDEDAHEEEEEEEKRSYDSSQVLGLYTAPRPTINHTRNLPLPLFFLPY